MVYVKNDRVVVLGQPERGTCTVIAPGSKPCHFIIRDARGNYAAPHENYLASKMERR